MEPGQPGHRLQWRVPVPPGHAGTGQLFHNEREPETRTAVTFPVDCMFFCGGCSTMYHMIWQLHEHLQLHTTGGSYHYDHRTRTAFPKYDSLCCETQTDPDDVVVEHKNKSDHFVCIGTQTEGSLTSFFCRQTDVEESDTNVKDLDSEVVVKVEKLDYDMQHGNSEAEGVDNVIKQQAFTPDDPYSGETDEETSLWEPEPSKKKKKCKNSKVKGKALVDTKTVIRKNIKFIGKSKTLKRRLRVKQEKDQRKTISVRSKRKDMSKTKTRTKVKVPESPDKNTSVLCKFCDLNFPNSMHLRRHCVREHPLEKNYMCRYCSGAFSSEAELHKHRKQHQREKLQCHVCKKYLSSPQNLQDHITMHTGEKMFECKDCGTYFRSRSQLTLHASRKHNPNYDHMCDNCGRVFKCRENLKGHIRYCLDIRPFRCEICGKRFPRNTNLNVHMRKHTGEKPFICHTCGMKFMHSNTLTKHMLVHTGERKFTCETCDMKFKAHNALKDHIRIHNQEKRFTCQFCGKGFIKKCNMVTHIRQHTGETPFKCHICGQGYKQNVLLKTHMQTHKHEPPLHEPELHQQTGPQQQSLPVQHPHSVTQSDSILNPSLLQRESTTLQQREPLPPPPRLHHLQRQSDSLPQLESTLRQPLAQPLQQQTTPHELLVSTPHLSLSQSLQGQAAMSSYNGYMMS